jgi:hypothetical protein
LISLREQCACVAYSQQKEGLVLGPPKSAAGVRTVSFPPAIIPDLKEHFRRFVADSPVALVFSGPTKEHPPLRRNNFRKLVGWAEAVESIGAAGLHFHDLRHTGNTESARTGASTKDLMVRMGHDSPRAALKYQHATAQADKAIADALSAAVRALGGSPSEGQSDDDWEDGAAGVLARSDSSYGRGCGASCYGAPQPRGLLRLWRSVGDRTTSDYRLAG